MNNRPCILSTKKLSSEQKKVLNNINIDDFDFIKITQHKGIQVSFPIENAIFTSKNAIKSLFNAYKKEEITIKNCFCVGKTTAEFLKKQGYNVAMFKNSAKELAQAILEIKTIKEIHFFCGNLRRNELFDVLEEHQIKIIEKEMYKTELTPVSTTKKYDGILFFSPSGIKSYLLKNKNKGGVIFCIGNTTATKAIHHFETVFVAETPSIYNVLNTVKKYYE